MIHPNLIEEDELITARFEFKPDRAEEFGLEGGQLIKQLEFPNTNEGVSELIDYCEQFKTALVDVKALINGRVIIFSDCK